MFLQVCVCPQGGGVHGGWRAWHGGLSGGGCAWQGVARGRGHAWLGGVHGKGEGHARRGPTHHPSGRYYGYGIRSMSGRYTSTGMHSCYIYWYRYHKENLSLNTWCIPTLIPLIIITNGPVQCEYALMAYFHCRTRIRIQTRTRIPVLCRYCGKGIQIWIWVSGNMFCMILCSHRAWNPNPSPNLNPSPAVEMSPERCVHLPRTLREVLRRKRCFADWYSAPGFLRFCPQSRWWWSPVNGEFLSAYPCVPRHSSETITSRKYSFSVKFWRILRIFSKLRSTEIVTTGVPSQTS